MLAISLPEEVELRLEALAQATGRSVAFYAEQAIIEHLGDLEDFYLAEREAEEVRAGRSQCVPLETLMEEYGLAD